jgi:hypothetical protein
MPSLPTEPPRIVQLQSKPASASGTVELLRALSAALWVDQHSGTAANPMRELCETGDLDALAQAAESDPVDFCAEALRLLRASGPFPARERLVRVLMESDVLIAPLCDPLSFSRAKALNLASIYATVQPRLASRILARMLSPAIAAASALSGLAAERALEIIAATGDPRQLEEGLCILLDHANLRIRSKIALLIAQARPDPQWVSQRILLEPDARLRANLIEGLWRTDSDEARDVLWDAAGDADNRVVANALLGLAYLGETEALPLIRRMTVHPHPLFRISGAWAMGETGEPSYASDLDRLQQDAESSVRRMATRALARLRDVLVRSA